LYKANVIADDDGCPDNSDTPVGAATTATTDDLHKYTNSESDTQNTDDDVDENDDDADAVDDDNDDGEMSLSVISRSAQTIVMRNLCGVIYQLSAYPTLTIMYKFLSSVAVSSCSAERCLSRVRIVENRLRSTMQDNWFSSLTLLACELDISESLRVEDVVDKLAGFVCSPSTSPPLDLALSSTAWLDLALMINNALLLL
jgi:hypothetical protein